jgi:DMSO/TMAO reductase YedYZ molybdopterin-dependent catalytic subunit
MVGHDDFQKLAKEEQVAYVQCSGRYVHYRIKGWCMIHLYLVGAEGPLKQAYFVELWYLYDLKSIGLIRSFKNTDSLDPYLQNIILALA